MLQAYTDISEETDFPDWDNLHRETVNGDLNWIAQGYGCKSMAAIGDNPTSDFEAILTLEGATSRAALMNLHQSMWAAINKH